MFLFLSPLLEWPPSPANCMVGSDDSSTRSLAVSPDMIAIGTHDGQPDVESKQATDFSKILRNMILRRLVWHNPSRLIYHHVKGEEGFASSDSIVAVHKVMKVDLTEQCVLVDIASIR